METLEYFQDLPEELREIIIKNLLEDEDFWKDFPKNEDIARENVMDHINRNNTPGAWKEWC